MTQEHDPVLGRAIENLRAAPTEPRWVDISSSVLSKIRATTRRTTPLDARFPTAPAEREHDTLRISDAVVTRAIRQALLRAGAIEISSIALYLDESICTGAEVSVTGTYGDDLRSLGSQFADAAVAVLDAVLGPPMPDRSARDIQIHFVDVHENDFPRNP